MTVVSVREVTPHVGKEKLVKAECEERRLSLLNMEHTCECIRQ